MTKGSQHAGPSPDGSGRGRDLIIPVPGPPALAPEAPGTSARCTTHEAPRCSHPSGPARRTACAASVGTSPTGRVTGKPRGRRAIVACQRRPGPSRPCRVGRSRTSLIRSRRPCLRSACFHRKMVARDSQHHDAKAQRWVVIVEPLAVRQRCWRANFATAELNPTGFDSVFHRKGERQWQFDTVATDANTTGLSLR